MCQKTHCLLCQFLQQKRITLSNIGVNIGKITVSCITSCHGRLAASVSILIILWQISFPLLFHYNCALKRQLYMNNWITKTWCNNSYFFFQFLIKYNSQYHHSFQLVYHMSIMIPRAYHHSQECSISTETLICSIRPRRHIINCVSIINKAKAPWKSL